MKPVVVIIIAVIACIISTAQAVESPHVLFDSGNTAMIAPLIQATGLKKQESSHAAGVITTPGLTPGEQPRLATGSLGLPQPVFIIGADAESIAWLTEHRDRLTAIGAIGMIVQASGVHDIERLRSVARDLVLMNGTGVAGAIARQFGVTHYPVLVGPQWIEQ